MSKKTYFLLRVISVCVVFFLQVAVVVAQDDVSGEGNADARNLFLKNSEERLFRKSISCMLVVENYEFNVSGISGNNELEERKSFSAEFLLVNRTGSAIDLELISHCGEEKPVQFILRNEESDILWQYIFVDPLVGCPDFLEVMTLPNKRSLRYSAEIPLVIDGDLLEPGEYSLEALIDGRPLFKAIAPIHIE